jgi:UDP-3-O-[3-hydroxymyristoyl] glucosamine N-acyltransferase
MFPFDDNASWARNTALVRHLAELAERVGALEKPPRKQRKVRNG